MPTFLEIQSKETIKRLHWCTKKNLLGMILENGSFQLYRVSFKANKIKEMIINVDNETQYTSFAFSPDSDQIAVGKSNGELIVSKIGDHFEVLKWPSKSSVFLMRWLQLASQEELGELNPLLKNSAIEKFLPPIEAHKGSKEDNIMKLNLFSNPTSSYSLLCSLDVDFNLGLTINGHFDLGLIELPAILGKDLEANPNFAIHDIFFEQKKDFLAVLHSESAGSVREMQLSVIGCSFIKDNKDSLIRIGIYLSYLQEILTNFGHTLDALAASVKTIEVLYRTPFFSYEDLLAEDDRYKDLTPSSDLLRVFRVGEMSNAFHKFLSKSIERDHLSDVHTVPPAHPENLQRVQQPAGNHHRLCGERRGAGPRACGVPRCGDFERAGEWRHRRVRGHLDKKPGGRVFGDLQED